MAEMLQVNEDNRDVAAGRAADAIATGALVVIPTDTVYGLVADARRPDSLARIHEAKSRESGKPVALLAADAEAVRCSGAEWTDVIAALASRFWPGPLTLVLQCGERQEGFRVPDHALARDIAGRCGGLLRATSANMSGQPDALSASMAMTMLGDRVELILDAGTIPGGDASTVVRVVNDACEQLRAGPVPMSAITQEQTKVKL